MITITAADYCTGRRWAIQPVARGWLNGSDTVPPFLCGIGDVIPGTVFQDDMGWIRQGTQKWGQLRDHEVEHLNIDADLAMPIVSYAYDYEDGYPRAKRGAVYQPFVSVLDWPWSASHTGSLDFGTLSYGGATWKRDPCPVFRQFIPAGGNYVAFSVEIGWTPTYKNDVLQGSPAVSYGTEVYFYRRLNSVLAVSKVQSFSGQLTSSEVLSKLSNAITTGVWYTVSNTTGYTDWWTAGLGMPTGTALRAVTDSIASFDGWHNLIREEEPVDFGELAVECARQLDYIDSNVISLVFDVRDWSDFRAMWKNLRNANGWRKALRVFRSIGSGKARWKDIPLLFKPGSSLFLFGRYGVLPSSNDVERLWKGVEKLATSPTRKRLHSRREVPLSHPTANYANFVAVLTVEVGAWPNGVSGKIQELIGKAKRWGIYPECADLADLVKYSFVLDWFVQFGEVLRDVDTYLNVKNYFPVEYCILSTKWTAGYESAEIVPFAGITGVVEFSYYVRKVKQEVPLPAVDPLEIGIQDDGQNFMHVVESAALILQRL